MSTKDTNANIRINSLLKAQATEYAAKQSRSLSGLIEYLLKQELAKCNHSKV